MPPRLEALTSRSWRATDPVRGDHYIPATIDGCPVKALAERPFVFKMRR